MRTSGRVGLGALVLSVIGTMGWGAAPSDAALGDPEQVDVSTAGIPADDVGSPTDMSGNGRYITFTSPATNLVPGDTNGVGDVFLRDRVAGTTRLVSTSGSPANAPSYGASVSDDGRYVAFTSSATNLAGGAGGVFLKDMTTGTVRRIGLGGSAEISDNGRYVAYGTVWETRRWDRAAGTSVPVNAGGSPQISGSGRFVVTRTFDEWSQPSYLFTDLDAGTTRDLWQKAEDSPDYSWDDVPSSPLLSANGRYVGFSTDGSGFHPADLGESEEIYLVDTANGDKYLRATAEWVNQIYGYDAPIAISGNGRVLAFFTDIRQLVVYDRVSGMTTVVTGNKDYGDVVLDSTGSRVAYQDEGNGIYTGTIPACTINGTTGEDTLVGTPDRDVICGHGGNDVIEGRGGNDVLAGGPGTDTVSFSRSNHDVVLRLYTWRSTGAGIDEVYGFENIDGSAYDDLLVGDNKRNRLRGLAGNDELLGHGDDDALVGGGGTDRCIGGRGTDTALACEIVSGVP